jgi:hypothetical protein
MTNFLKSKNGPEMAQTKLLGIPKITVTLEICATVSKTVSESGDRVIPNCGQDEFDSI